MDAGEEIPFNEDRTVPLETYVAHTGIYKNNKQNGKGKSYSDDTYLLYVGEYKNADFEGEGTEYTNGKIVYRGSFSKGEYDGKGTLYDNEGKIEKKGKFVNGIWKGDN
jgi:antitoxin component YwqK of YwqJK toxin-antitoxin module